MSSHPSPARFVAAISLIFLLGLVTGPNLTANEKAKSAAAFERLISLVGEWEGTANGSPVKATYTLVSGGTALMERLQPSNESEMLTLYTLDGDHLLVTHYCSSGNQPQMKTAAITDLNGVLTFKVYQVSGMKSVDEGHMTALIVTMPDKDHFTQEWTYKEKGHEHPALFIFTRKS